MDKVISDKIERYFKNKKGVVAVYVFGSYAQRRERESSDIDLAVLFTRDFIPSGDQSFEIKNDVSSLLKKDVDLIILNSANPILKHQIYKHGKTIIISDTAFINDFFVYSLMEYTDIKMTRAIIEKKILNRRTYG